MCRDSSHLCELLCELANVRVQLEHFGLLVAEAERTVS